MCPLGAQMPDEDPPPPPPRPTPIHPPTLLQVHMTEHLIECGLYLFKYLRSLQVCETIRPG